MSFPDINGMLSFVREAFAEIDNSKKKCEKSLIKNKQVIIRRRVIDNYGRNRAIRIRSLSDFI